MLKIVLIAVIVTLKPKSALKRLHHQFEKLPPGELVTTKRVSETALLLNSFENIFTAIRWFEDDDGTFVKADGVEISEQNLQVIVMVCR